MTLVVVSFDVMKIQRRTNRRMLIKTTGVAPERRIFVRVASRNFVTSVSSAIAGAGDTGFGAIVEALHPVQKQLSREINPKVFSAREWIAKRKQRNPFVSEVLGKPKIFLLGTENDLTELGRHKP